MHISPQRALQLPGAPSRWRHPITFYRWRRYVRRVRAVEHALARIGATSDTRLTLYGIAALAVDFACYDGRRFREIVGIEWERLAAPKVDEWWHEPADSNTAGGES